MPTPTPAEIAASLVSAETDNVEVLRLVRAALENRTGLILSPAAAPADPGSASYLECLDRIRDGRNLNPVASIIQIETLIRSYSHSGAHWQSLLSSLIELASAARTAYADAINQELGAP